MGGFGRGFAVREFVRELRELFEGTADMCCLALVLPQVWLWIMLRAVDQSGSVPSFVFYVAESVSLLIVLLIYRKRTRPAAMLPRGISWGAAVLMAASPMCVLYGGQLLDESVAFAGTFAAGVALIWAYAEFFVLCSHMEPRRAASCLLLSFAVVPLVRLPLDMLPVASAALLVGPLPLVYVLAVRHAAARFEGKAGVRGHRGEMRALHVRAAQAGTMAQGGLSGSMVQAGTAVSPSGFTDACDRLVRVVAELAVFGFAMGFLRFDAQGIHDNAVYVFANFTVKTALPLVALALVGRHWQLAGVGSLCQAALVALLVLMVIAANLPGVPGVSFVVFDIARYIMVVLLFLALTALVHRTELHPCTLFAAGMGTYTFALTAGMAVASVLGLDAFDQYPPVLVLDVMCVLAVTTVLAMNMGHSADLRLFADGESDGQADDGREDELEARCAALAQVFNLTRRELETMRLICRGRSKRYIAEHMALSENTVRGYAKTLYAKLDVHSREELIDLLERRRV